jgi:poly(A) polymerase
MLKRILNLFKSDTDAPSKVRIIPRDQHQVSRKHISQGALKVIKQLQDANFEAYLVGGGVRDLLLGNTPKDFDVATNATPEQVKQQFRGARIIGRRFQIVHVRMGREIIEVTTFRGHHEDHETTKNQDGMLLRDNVYGTLETDALRRDFTVNALYYDLNDFSVIDYCNGMKDLEKRRLRIIGDPATRYKEDPVRILRAIRFAAKLGFSIESATAKPIAELSPLLLNVSDARLFEELLKLFLNGSATATFALLQEYDLLSILMPGTDDALKSGDSLGLALIEKCMTNTDKRIRADKTVTPAFLYAALLWPSLQMQFKKLSLQLPPALAWTQACQQVIQQQLTRTAIPKRFTLPMREIWDLQQRLPQRSGLRALRSLDHPRFRAAYDFLLMREDAGEDLQGLGQWWTIYQTADENKRIAMVKDLNKPQGERKPRSRRPRKPKASSVAE